MSKQDEQFPKYLRNQNDQVFHTTPALMKAASELGLVPLTDEEVQDYEDTYPALRGEPAKESEQDIDLGDHGKPSALVDEEDPVLADEAAGDNLEA